jgi:hypothetical protein
MSAYPSQDPGDEARPERVIAHAEQGVREGGRCGTGARPALAVPRGIMDVAMDEILDVIQDNEPGLAPESDLQEPDDAT